MASNTDSAKLVSELRARLNRDNDSAGSYYVFDLEDMRMMREAANLIERQASGDCAPIAEDVLEEGFNHCITISEHLDHWGLSEDEKILLVEAILDAEPLSHPPSSSSASDEVAGNPSWEWERRGNDSWFFTIPRVEYWVAFSIDENSGEVWHAYVDAYGPEQDGELADKIGVYRTASEARDACVRHSKPSPPTSASSESAPKEIDFVPRMKRSLKRSWHKINIARNLGIQPDQVTVAQLCDWPEGTLFSVKDDPDEHKPCYLVGPGGEMYEFKNHATNGVDQCRASFIARACNFALKKPTSAAPGETG